MTGFVTRFAPSPTGLLHLGHAFSAACAFGAAAAAGGVCLLRIEDIDTTRCRPAFEAAILEDLAWLGFSWPTPVLRQSERAAVYDGVVAALAARGLAYRCFRTRTEIAEDIARAPHGPGEVYLHSGLPVSDDEADARAAAGEAFAWRLDARRAAETLGEAVYVEEDLDGSNARPVAADPLRLGDAILARKDALASYHVACCHDDAAQGVTHVIRGEDLREAANLHVCLQRLMGWPTPVYRHHGLIAGEDGKRLAKRDRAATLRALRESGAKPEDVLARIAAQAAT